MCTRTLGSVPRTRKERKKKTGEGRGIKNGRGEEVKGEDRKAEKRMRGKDEGRKKGFIQLSELCQAIISVFCCKVTGTTTGPHVSVCCTAGSSPMCGTSYPVGQSCMSHD